MLIQWLGGVLHGEHDLGNFTGLMHGFLLRSASWLQACKAADELKANLEEEYVAVRTFIVEFCKCMDYIQHAKMLVSGCECDTLPFLVLPGFLVRTPVFHCAADALLMYGNSFT